MKMLDRIKGINDSNTPDRVVLYGVDGVGKSTWGAGAPDPIFVSTEDGLGQIDVDRVDVGSYAEVKEMISDLTNEDHRYQTLVVDSIDWLEPLIWAAICDSHGWDSIEKPGYGKGYAEAAIEWRRLIVLLDQLRSAREMGVIMIAHASIRNFSDPTGVDYARYEIALQRLASGIVAQWADSILFACHEHVTREEGSKVKASGTGRRIVKTVWDAGYQAENRYCLPPVLDLEYTEYDRHRRIGVLSSEKLYSLGVSMVERVDGNGEVEKIREYLETVKTDRRRLIPAVRRIEDKFNVNAIETLEGVKE